MFVNKNYPLPYDFFKKWLLFQDTAFLHRHFDMFLKVPCLQWILNKLGITINMYLQLVITRLYFNPSELIRSST